MSTRLVGRSREQSLLAESLELAVAGAPSAVVVRGEAGIGKTRLVSSAREYAEEQGFAVLWGTCVRFEAATVPFAPLIGALDPWIAGVPDDLRAQVTGLGLDGGVGATRMVPAIGAVIAHLCAIRPVLLVIDDLHWADATSLDVLAYLVTGFRSQPLAIVATARDEEVGVGHPLNGWLADLRRLPSFTELRLGRLDSAETHRLVAEVLGRDPGPGLAEEIYVRSAGNAYLTELLVRSLEPDAKRLPAGLPVALREALLGAWHRLSSDARLVVQLVAVGGRPIGHADLERVANACGIDPAILSTALVEAVDRGLLAVGLDAGIWFHHPLTAEVVEGTLFPGQAVPIHRAFIARLTEAGTGNVRVLADLARHHELAGDANNAFDCAVRAAAGAALLQGFAEQAANLGHAVELWPRVTTSRGNLVTLLRDATDAAIRAGDDQAAYDYAERALGLVDRTENPLLAARLLCEWCGLVFRTGRVSRYPLAEAEQALALTSALDLSVEHVLALATVAEAHAWRGNREIARRRSDAALEAAEACGEAEGTAWALATQAFVWWGEPVAVDCAVRAYEFATTFGYHQVAGRAAVWRSNALWDRGRFQESAEAASMAFAQASTSRPSAASTAYLAALGATRFLDLGDFAQAAALIREGLAVRASGIGGAGVRLSAARLAIMTGHLDEAGQHLGRVEELIPSIPEHVGLGPQPVYASYLVAMDRPSEAVELLHRSLPSQAPDPGRCDHLLVWGARACADLAQRARDRNDLPAAEAARDSLESLVALRTSLGHSPFETVTDDLETLARKAVFEAESARCRVSSGTAEVWRSAVSRLRSCGFRYEEALASLRLAEAILKQSRRPPDLAEAVRRTHRLAIEIGANPLRDKAVALARLARISLAEPVARRASTAGPVHLTQREREVLAQLVVGRSYREIAVALFISEKTVSAHISNMLRKTDTTNRNELAALADRLRPEGSDAET